MAANITIHSAREIVTMNPSNPSASHVAVRDGRILGVGPLDELTIWGDHTLDHTFADHVLVPGMIEAHAHLLEGALWAFPYVGYFPRRDPSGQWQGGLTTIEELVDHLAVLDASLSDPDQALFCWGLDPIYFDGDRLTARHLDRASSTRQIVVFHASLHLATVNTACLEAGAIADAETEGVVRDEHGRPTGELQEVPAMMLAPPMTPALKSLRNDQSYWTLARLAVNAGVTTVTDLASQALFNQGAADASARIVNDPAYPLRFVPYCTPSFGPTVQDDDAVAARFHELAATNTDKLHYGGIKLIADGSIQGYTAVMNWPGYVTGAPQGLWQVPPDRLDHMVRTYHEAGINVHIHANGDAVIDAAIDAVDRALRTHAWLDHRHTVQHCQLTSAAQYRRMARLGMCGNLFANHLWFWGDQHYASTVGPERAHRLEAAATAKREGVRFSLHSDAAVTPLGQLHTMWCAVNRLTPSGRVLGEHERISAYDALHAVTVGAAYQLHLDHVLGSIEVGKHADFTVLEENPLTVHPIAIRDIGVWGTVLGGVPRPAGSDPIGPTSR
ncbi:MAG: amidohydrolase [Ilumatobacter sp.]|nr:MAG: amidohydrolase [Ilumatobacter sp.]